MMQTCFRQARRFGVEHLVARNVRWALLARFKAEAALRFAMASPVPASLDRDSSGKR
jgi:hypothetical protein